MKNFNKIKKLAFTLSETSIVIVVIGIIASLTIPSIIRNNSEATQRTRIRKAVAEYEVALNTMVYENQLISQSKLTNWADTDERNNCANTSRYFKIVSGGGCTFKTADGVWWNIADIQRPLISLHRITENGENSLANTVREADDINNKTSFYIIGRYDENRNLRINDIAYETENPMDKSDKYMAKLYAFLYGKVVNWVEPLVCVGLPICYEEEYDVCLNTGYCQFEAGGYDEACPAGAADGEKFGCTSYKGGNRYVYNEDGDLIVTQNNCNNTTNICKDVYVKNLNARVTEAEKKNNKDVTLEVHKNADGTLNYTFERRFDEDGFKSQVRYSCNAQNKCTKEENYIKTCTEENNPDSCTSVMHEKIQYQDDRENIKRIDIYDSSGKGIANVTNCDSTGYNCDTCWSKTSEIVCSERKK